MPVTASAPDGSVHEFPDGTDPAIVDKTMKAYITGAMQGSTADLSQDQPQKGWGRFLATAGAHAVAGLGDLAVKPFGLEEFARTPEGREKAQAPFTSAADAALKKTGMLYEPESAGERIGLAATEGAMGAATGGAGALGRGAKALEAGGEALSGALVGGGLGGAQQTVTEAVPEKLKPLVGAVSAIIAPLVTRGRAPTAGEATMAKVTALLDKAGIPKEQHAAIIKAAQEQGQTDFSKSGNVLQAGKRAEEQEATAAHESAVADTAQKLKATTQSIDQIVSKGLNGIRAEAARNNPGDFPTAAANAITDVRRQLGQAFSQRYTAAEGKAGGIPIDAGAIRDAATEFRAQLPEDLARMFPDVTKKLADLGQEGEPGTPAQDPTMTLGELHYLRSQLRDMKGNPSLPGSIKKLPFAKMEAAVNDTINSVQNDPVVRSAAKDLRAIDRDYSRQMAKFNSGAIQSVVGNMQPGFPENTHVALSLFKDNASGALDKILRMGGPELERSLKGSVLRDTLQESEITRPGETPTHDPASILDTIQKNRTGWSRLFGAPTVAGWERDLGRMAARDGKLPSTMELPADGFTRLLAREKELQARADRLAKANPLQALDDISKKSGDPELISTGALPHAVSSRILGDSDLTRSAVNRFGINSPQVKALKEDLIQNLVAQIYKAGDKGLASSFSKMKTDVVTQLLNPETVGHIRTIAGKLLHEPDAESTAITGKVIGHALAHAVGYGLTGMLARTGGPAALRAMARMVTIDPKTLPAVRAAVLSQATAEDQRNQQ